VKVFFDTNVYVAEDLLGQVAEQLLEATERASWRIYASLYLLDELEPVLTEKLGFSRRLAVAVHRGIYVSSARTATATNEERLVLHGTVPQLYPRRAA
jgi:predicted nucleic acid-binding protein